MQLIDLLKEKLQDSSIDILSHSEATQRYGKTTFSTPTHLDAALIIHKESAVSEVLRLANELKFNIFPVSTCKNWGYGSFLPQSNRQNVVLDLSQLQNIIATDKEMGLVTLQPGVTQQQLHQYLVANEWPFMVPVTGAGPHCSLVSNALERGYGITPHNDHFYACTALKAYLPHPELCDKLYESAISGLDQSSTDFIDKTYKWGLGPYIDGLFTQSNFAVVTEMTIRLAPKPNSFCAFYLQVFDESNFEDTVLLIRETLLKFAGIVGSINLMDQRRLISITSDNPNGTDNDQLMSDEQIKTIAKQNKLPKWMVVGSIYGDKNIINASKKEFKKKASSLGKIYFSDSTLFTTAKFLLNLPLPNLNILNKLRNQLNSMQEGIDIMLGIPNQVALPLPYWKNSQKKADKSQVLSPSEDECGLLWYAPLLKMTPKSLFEFVEFIRSTTPKYGIEPFITFTNLKHDCVDSTVPLVFNLKSKQAIENAHTCLNELIENGMKKGFVPYRLDVNQQNKLKGNQIFWQTTDILKQALDPNRILSPNRYNPKCTSDIPNI